MKIWLMILSLMCSMSLTCLMAQNTTKPAGDAKEGAAATAENDELPPPPDPTKEIPADKLKTIEKKNAAGTVIQRYVAYVDEHGREIKHGLYQEWYDSGVLSREMTYDHGMPDGRQRWWHPNGMLWMEFKTKRGVRDGTYQEFFPTGKLKNRWVYKDGKIISRH